MTITGKELVTIEQAIKKLKTFTIPDIAGETGLSTFDSKRGVETLIKKYKCRMQVTDRGELIYDFGNLVRQGSKTVKEQVDEVGKLLWKGFTYFFKLWIMLMLVGYFIVFVILLLVIVIASLASNDRDRGLDFGSGIPSLIFRIAAEFFFWNTITGNLTYRRDRFGYRYRQFEPVKSDLFKGKSKSQGKKFITSVFDYVFGPHRAEIHPQENQREVATYIRQNKGIITIEEVRALAGWEGRKADEFFTQMISNYDGEIKVSDKGVIYGDFTGFLSGKNSEKTTDIVFYWDEFEPEYNLNGNSTERNMIITAMNLFVLLMSYGVLSGRILLNVQDPQTFQLIFGLIPFIYASLFFIIPLVRMFFNDYKEKQRRLHNIRKRLMKEIYLGRQSRIPLTQLQESLNSSSEIIEKVDEKSIQQIMSDEIIDWKGDPIVDDNAKMVYDFSLLRESQTEAKNLRAKRQLGVTTGQTVFDTATI